MSRKSSTSLSRRSVLKHLARASLVGPLLPNVLRATQRSTAKPWDHRFLFFADATVTYPGELCYNAFSQLTTTIGNLELSPDFILSTGDDIYGNTENLDELRSQWEHVLRLTRRHLGEQLPFYTSPSNHNIQGPAHVQAWKERFGYLPQNGAPGQTGLSYSLRRGNLLLVATHQSDPQHGGHANVEVEWLEKTLGENSDADYKVVFGHYPAIAVNGLRVAPLSRLVQPDRDRFWAVLVKHNVDLYLCGHIQSFDGRVADGIMQVCSAGACNGSRPPDSEYQHLALVTLNKGKIYVESVDSNGKIREWFSWPFADVLTWKPFDPKALNESLDQLRPPSSIYGMTDRRLLAFRIHGRQLEDQPGSPKTLVSGHKVWQQTETIWIGLEGFPSRLTVRLQPRHYFWQQVWTGPEVRPKDPFHFEVMLDSGLGPGGILWRSVADPAKVKWTSFESACSSGIDQLRWPEVWQTGVGMLADDDRLFKGELKLDYAVQRSPYTPFF